MPTKNPRINIAVEPPLYKIIERIAKAQGISMSMATRDLLKEALVLQEDAALSLFAEEREDSLSSGDTLSHSEVWD